MARGYMERIGFVDLSTGIIKEERLDERLARDFIGGYGLGVRILFELQKGGVDPLGPENILGFTTGPLTGTQVPTGSRYMAVCKSPITGGWGDANAGGYFGSMMKTAGWDAIFVSGMAASPKYLLVNEKGIELREASHLWGQDTVETEDRLRKEIGISKCSIACIGPASEKLSLISGISNDKGRFAARSGVGAVMGSKRLKAVVVHGKQKVEVADKSKVSQLRRDCLRELKHLEGPSKIIRDYGTCGLTGAAVTGGATPIKNWLLAGEQAYPALNEIADVDKILKYQVRKYGCANCPIACGGILNVSTGPYPVKELHKPEYETLAAFGPLCSNSDLLSIIKMNDICNRGGLDTISAGSAIAFAMECFEKGIISKKDTDGIELTWGNAEAMIAMLYKMIRREGFGDVLANGVKDAAQKIGKGSQECAIHVGGQEPGLHNALFLPGRGTGFVCDPTPGRHTTGGCITRVDSSAVIAPYPELQFHNFERYEYKNKGNASVTASCYWQVGTCSGVCMHPVIFWGNYPLLEFLNAVTGWDMDIEEILKIGARIQTLRQVFNLREGIDHSTIKLPPRLIGIPPKNNGPLAGITIDIESLASEYNKAMGWDPRTGSPTPATLEHLGLNTLVEGHWESIDET